MRYKKKTARITRHTAITTQILLLLRMILSTEGVTESGAGWADKKWLEKNSITARPKRLHNNLFIN